MKHAVSDETANNVSVCVILTDIFITGISVHYIWTKQIHHSVKIYGHMAVATIDMQLQLYSLITLCQMSIRVSFKF